MIKINNLNKIYNKGKSNQIHVINNTTLQLPSTGIIAFLGASGSGKTTLLNVIGGLDSAKGTINYDNEEFANYKMSKVDNYRRENIGYVFQNYNLLPNISVYDNLAISLNLIGITDENEINKRIEYCLKAVKMGKYKKRLANALSGGQQQRISIARALVKNAKIIIADEPTGNLDSVNTIEVMNILRKISETKLVLLVTHDRNIAHFYCDRIIEIKDGSIISEKENDAAFQSLDTRNTNTVYLKDLQKADGTFNNISMTIYHEEGQLPSDLELVLVYKNGNIYIDTKQRNVKLVGANTEIKLLNENYKQLEKSEIENYSFDLSTFSDVKIKRKFNIKSIFLKIKTALANFIGVRVRTKLLYFGLFVIGCLIATSVISLGMTSYIDESYLYYDKDAYAIYDKDNSYNYEKSEEFNQKLLNIIKKDENITDIVYSYQQASYLNINMHLNASIENVYLNVNALALSTNLLKDSDLYNNVGSINAKDNEVVIDKVVADKIIKEADKFIKLKYEDLIDLKFNEQYKIVGITNRKSNSIYLNQKMLSNFKYRNYWDIDIGKPNSLFEIYKAEYDEGYFSYDIVYGNSLSKSNEKEILVNIDLVNSYLTDYPIGGTVQFQVASEISVYKIVGYFKSSETNANYIVNQKAVRYMSSTNDYKYYSTDNIGNTYDYKLISGKLPTAENEAIMSIYSGCSIGDYVNDMYGKEYKITGLYFATDGNEKLLISRVAYFNGIINNIGYYGRSSLLVFSNDSTKTIEYFADEGIVLQGSYEALKAIELYNTRQNKSYLVIMGIVLLVVVIIYVFFMMRAKMISRIYDIGVYRALGATKTKIYSMFIVELLVQTTLTTLLGYIITTLFVMAFGKALSDLGDLFHFNTLYSILGVIFLYASNLIFGLLPVMLLLRKTPSEIIAKYDI